MTLPPGLFFRAMPQPTLMLDANLGHAQVLLIGHWVDADGREVKADVCTFTATRDLHDLRPLPPIHTHIAGEAPRR